jgi:nitroreductase
MRAVDSEHLQRYVRAAVAAPSIHNTQPWLFVLHPDRIEVHADRRRLLPSIDPTGRELYISLGAAILNLRIAMAADGHHDWTRLFPNGTARTHVADVSVGPPRHVERLDRELYDAVARRRTNRNPFIDRKPPAGHLDDLVAAARRERAELAFHDGDSRDALLAVVRTATVRQEHDGAYRSDLAVWTADRPGRPDGVPPSAYGGWSVMGILPVRDFGLGQPGARFARRFESVPLIATLSTFGDTPAEWLDAGQALQRVLLVATTHGLDASFMTQPLEVAETRELLGAGPRQLTVQMILRLGYGEPAAASPRRPVSDVVVDQPPENVLGGQR